MKRIITSQVDTVFSGKAMQQLMENGQFESKLAEWEKKNPNDPRIAQMRALQEKVYQDPARIDLTKATFFLQDKHGGTHSVSGERMRQLVLIGALVFFGVAYLLFSL